ncbi:MAG: OmpH family outer membrane protein [Caulobacteraceae bacterium]|nr:OmpH family outer membrane protein [Caulobacteraceae bacterium]
MQIKTYAAAAAVAACAAFAATAASAATAAAPAAAPVVTGPAIPGMCVLSNDAVLGGSAVGKFVITRLGQLKAQVDAELNSEGTALQTDAKALDAQRSSLSADQYDQKAAAIQIRDRELQRKAQLRQRELQATQDKAFNVVGQQAEPIVRQVIAERNCSILLNGAAVVVASPAMDISPTVVQRLDGKIQQFAFDREHLDTTAGPPAQ